MPEPEPSRSPREVDLGRYLRLAALYAACFVLLVAVGVYWLGAEATLVRLGRLGPGLVLLVLSLSALNYFLRTLRWQALCQALGIRVPLARNGLYYVAGFAFTITPGHLGEVVRLWLLRRYHRASYERTLGLLLMDRVTDAVPLLALSLVGASRFAGQGWSIVAVAGLVLAGLTLVLRPAWLGLLVKLVYGRLRRPRRLFARILRMLRALQALVAPLVLGTALILGLIGWSAEIVGAWLVLGALGAEVDLVATTFVFGFSMLVGGLPLFPGGIGGAEGTMITLLLLLGVDAATAVAATAIIRLATLGFAVALGFLVLPVSLTRPPPAQAAAAREPARDALRR